MADVVERIEQLCVLLESGELDEFAGRAGVGEVLARIRSAVADRGPDPALAPDLDALDDALARAGLGAVTQPERRYAPLPGMGAGHPVVYAWTCPAPRQCGRTAVPGDDGVETPLRCALTGRELVRVRVRT